MIIFYTAFTFLVIVVATLYWKWRSSHLVRLTITLPGLTIWSANIKGMFLNEDGISKSIHLKWARQYGPIYRTWMLNKPMIVLTSPEMMEPIISTSKSINKSFIYDWWKPWWGDSVAISTGNIWKARRRLLTPAFHAKSMEKYLDVFNEKSVYHASQLENMIGANNMIEINIYSIIIDLALDLVCANLLGFTYTGYKEKTQYAQNLDRFDEVIIKRLMNPLLAVDWIFWRTPLGSATKNRIESLRSFTDPVMKDKGRISNQEENTSVKPESGNSQSSVFLDLIFHSSGIFRTNQEIQGEIDTYVQGAHDTITITLSLLIYCLARHQDMQEKLVEEIQHIFGADKDRPCSKQDLSELKYLECCIKETLRLYPGNPSIMRCLTEDVEVGGYTLPAGATVILAIHGMHRNPKVYSNPDSFKPERFLPEQSEERHPNAFMSFSSGPRNCVGRNYAMLEMKTVMTHLLRRFHFSSPEHPDDPLMMPARLVILKPINGINIIVRKRH